jgi:hypothetical protein
MEKTYTPFFMLIQNRLANQKNVRPRASPAISAYLRFTTETVIKLRI